MKKWLTHEEVPFRAAALWILCLAVLLVTWSVSYYTLPYGVLRNVFPSTYLPLGNSLPGVLLTIFAFNLVVGCGLTVAMNLLSVKSIPVGYFYPLVQIGLFGIFLGTDSFAVSHGTRFFPSVAFVGMPGFYEFTAYILFAAATAKFSLWNQTGWLGGAIERVKERKELRLAQSELFTMIMGALFLLLGAVMEANGILGI